jgi:hypothetical protein
MKTEVTIFFGTPGITRTVTTLFVLEHNSTVQFGDKSKRVEVLSTNVLY